MTADEPQVADLVAHLDWVATDLNDLWIAFDDGEHPDMTDALGRAIDALADARIALAEGRTDG